MNLIVGRNNAGKSTLLEALELYASNAAPTVILDLVENRQETWFSEAQPKSQNLTSNAVRHLFFGHNLPKIGEEGIVLGEITPLSKLHIGAAAYQFKSDDEGTTKRIRISETQMSLFDIEEDLANVDIYLIAEEGERTRRLFRLDRNIRDERRFGSKSLFNGQENNYKFTWQIIPTNNMPNKKLAALWDLTSLTNLDSEVISALRLIDERVSGVGFVEDVSQISQRRYEDNRIPLVKIDGIDEPLPLKSMGDGITRLFHMIVALVNAQDGLLLIDEFENGLHWSVQSKVWEVIFQLSEKLNVQVFATTHSRDCIEGFDSTWNKYPALGTFLRLDFKDEMIKATEYTSETLSDAIDMDVEVR